MQIVRTPGSARAVARTLVRPVGLVPTMGALHAGHRSLLERAVGENANAVASLFINPLQFGPNEDLGRYPRAWDDDLAQFEAAGIAVLYAPSVEAMYPKGFAVEIDPGPLGASFEGAVRPGHFRGVATVVSKLLHTLEPTTLYLGQKDAQQAAVLCALLRDLDFATAAVICPTVRELDGLALSSRNAYLTAQQRAAAPSFHRALDTVARAFEGGALDPDAAKAAGNHLLAAPLTWDYLEIVSPLTFVPLQRAQRTALVVGAVRAGTTRLIDNVPVAAA